MLIVGSNLRREMPHARAPDPQGRRSGAGAKVAFLNPPRVRVPVPGGGLRASAARSRRPNSPRVVRAAAAAAGKPVPAGVRRGGGRPMTHRALAAALTHGTRRAVMLGTLAQRHPAYAELKVLAAALAALTGASLGLITEGRQRGRRVPRGRRAAPRAGRRARGASAGLSARAMLEALAQGLCAVRRHRPGRRPRRRRPRRSRRPSWWSRSPRICPRACAPSRTWCCRSAPSPRASGTLRERRRALAELDRAPRKLVGESRPGWKVLRVLGESAERAGHRVT